MHAKYRTHGFRTVSAHITHTHMHVHARTHIYSRTHVYVYEMQFLI